MKTKPFIFTLMPFSSEFDDVYKLGIKETSEKLGAYCERVDEQIFDGTILDRIINQIVKADVIIADMTGKNPNVFFEVGYAKALNKKIVFLTQTAEDIPFDLKHFPHIVYNGKIAELREMLSKALDHHLSKPDAEAGDFELGLDLNINGVTLVPNEETIIPIDQEYGTIRLSIKNRTNRIIDANKIQIGAIGIRGWGLWPDAETKPVKISESEYMTLYTHPNEIFPQGWDSVKLFDIISNSSHKATLRVFTENGTFDFNFREEKIRN